MSINLLPKRITRCLNINNATHRSFSLPTPSLLSNIREFLLFLAYLLSDIHVCLNKILLRINYLVWVYVKLYKMGIIMVEIFKEFLFSLKIELLKFIHMTSYNCKLFHLITIL